MQHRQRKTIAILLAPWILPALVIVYNLPNAFRLLGGVSFAWTELAIVMVIAYLGNVSVALPTYTHYRRERRATLLRCSIAGLIGGALFATPLLLIYPPVFVHFCAVMAICGALVAGTFCAIAGPQSSAGSN